MTPVSSGVRELTIADRNVQCTVNPSLSFAHATVYEFSKTLSDSLLPKTTAYHEIWLDQKKVGGGEVPDFEPVYGPTYLPRKFKMAVAVPPDNGPDVFTNDLGFIAILEGDKVVGYNVTVGGGMGVTHSNKKTYPRLGDVIGFVLPEDGLKCAESVMLTQRDNGNRQDRKNAVSALTSWLSRWTDKVTATEVHCRPDDPPCVQEGGRVKDGQAIRASPTLHLHLKHRQLRLGPGSRWQMALHHLHREWSNRGLA